MPDAEAKRAIIAVLSQDSDFSGLVSLPSLNSREGRALQLWLDRSGLALYFWNRVRSSHTPTRISEPWRHGLDRRMAQNVQRTRDMLEEFRRLNSVFQNCGVTAAAMKGFTLVPDFCEDPSLRHQVDFDFFISQDSLKPAAVALESLGYATSQLNESGETCFRTRRDTVPTVGGDIYGPQPQRQVDLHLSLWEQSEAFPVTVPTDCLRFMEPCDISGVRFHGLSLPDRFLFQLLHIFRHSTHSWIRLSWLLEIARCLKVRAMDGALWNKVVERAGDDPMVKRIFAFILGLSSRIFHSRTPAPLRPFVLEGESLALRAWLDGFAIDWALTDWPGNLSNLLLASEFIPDRKLRMRYLRGRLVPARVNASMANIVIRGPRMFLALQANRAKYFTRRIFSLGQDIFRLPILRLRWKRALQDTRRAIS